MSLPKSAVANALNLNHKMLSFNSTLILSKFNQILGKIAQESQATTLDMKLSGLNRLSRVYRGQMAVALSSSPIRYFNVSSNALGLVDASIKTLFDGLAHTALTGLNLNFNALKKAVSKTLTWLITSISQSDINRLSLKGNELADKGARTFIHIMKPLEKSQLKYLDVSLNHLWKLGIKKFSDFIANLPAGLEVLDLSANDLGEMAEPAQIASILLKTNAEIIINHDPAAEAILKHLSELRRSQSPIASSSRLSAPNAKLSIWQTPHASTQCTEGGQPLVEGEFRHKM